jgi:hypothetical protein
MELTYQDAVCIYESMEDEKNNLTMKMFESDVYLMAINNRDKSFNFANNTICFYLFTRHPCNEFSLGKFSLAIGSIDDSSRMTFTHKDESFLK